MTPTSPPRTHPPRPRLTSRLLLLLPLLATGCSNAEVLLTIASLTFAGGVLLFVAGFAIGVEFCSRTYAHWESVIGQEYGRDILRLTEASTEIANDAEAAIRSCRAALRSLRRTATDIR